MRIKPWIALLLIVLFGLAIRIYKLQSLPMYGDELTMVYDTYSIAKTGMDSTGAKLPLTFKMGAGRPGGYIYFSVPLIELFGPTVVGVRALSILSSIGIIILVYFLGKKLFDGKVGVLASLLMTISPWDIYLSRGGFEAHFALFLALLGVTAFLYKRYIIWGIAWGLAIHTYPTFKLTLPLLGVLILWFAGVKNLLKSKFFLAGFIILLFFGVVVAMQTFSANSEQRFLSENILADQNISASILQRVNYERTISTLPVALVPIFINRPVEYTRMILENYVKNLSPEFLILRGDGNPRQNPGEMGMVFLVDLPLILIALSLLWRERRKEFTLILVWVLITPLATMFFPEAHALRNDLMLPALILLAAYAFTKIPKRLSYVAGFFILVQLIYILVRVYYIAPVKFAAFWSYDAQKLAYKAISDEKLGKSVVLSTKNTDNIEYAYEVYAKVDPKLVISQYGNFPKVFGKVTVTNN